MTPQTNRRSTFSGVLHALFYVFVFFTCQSAVTAGYMMAVMTGSMTSGTFDLTNVTALLEQVLSQTVMITLISNLLTLLFVSLYQTMRKRNPIHEFGLRPVSPFRCPTFLLFGAAMNIFISVTLYYLPLPESVMEAFENQYASLMGGMPLALEILSIAVVTGITEEIIFRGLVNSRLARSGMSAGAVVITSGVIFGLAHGTPIAVGYSMMIGLVFSVMYGKFRSVIPPLLSHVAFNAASYLITALDERWILPVYIVSAVLIPFCAYRIFFRRPKFYDVMLDTVGEYRLRDDTEREIAAELRRMRDDGTLTPEEVERLERAWTENDRRYGKNKQGRNKDED